jgi:hypothetical protein
LEAFGVVSASGKLGENSHGIADARQVSTGKYLIDFAPEFRRDVPVVVATIVHTEAVPGTLGLSIAVEPGPALCTVLIVQSSNGAPVSHDFCVVARSGGQTRSAAEEQRQELRSSTGG